MDTNFLLLKSFALSIYKIQCSTVNEAVLNLGSNIFEAGMGNVALSRVRTLAGLHLSESVPDKVFAATDVLEENERLCKISYTDL